MPEICRFFGMVMAIYYKDHAPPHFHVKYNEFRASIAIETLEVLEGNLPRKAYQLVLEWASEHRGELKTNWDRAMRAEPLEHIAPLA